MTSPLGGSALLVCTLLLLSIGTTAAVYADRTESKNPTRQAPCNCVVFRLDDVQDYWLSSVQIKLMETFASTHQKLTLGEIMNFFGSDQRVVNATIKGGADGTFEYAIHGWNHVDYSNLTLEQQQMELMLANDKMQTIYGKQSDIFLTPYNEFDNDTLLVMKALGIHVLSAATYSNFYSSNTNTPWAPNADEYGIYHAPETVSFGIYENGIHSWAKKGDMMQSIVSGIKSRGWSVVTIHPQDFSNYAADKITAVDTLNKTSFNRLGELINSIHSRGYSIASFHDLVHSAPQPEAVPPVITVSPNGGNYTQTVNVRLTADKPSKIFYTVDGTTPTASSHVYHNKIRISEPTTLKYFAVDRIGNASPIMIMQYTIAAHHDKEHHSD